MRRTWLIVGSLLLLCGCSNAGVGLPGSANGPTGRVPTERPNIVFVLTDDLSWNLLPYMPHVQAMQRAGLTFTDYTVSDSLCCPSRSSIFSGRFPHDTGVFTNTGKDGGFNVFHSRGEENHTYSTALRAAGYRTAMMGKYLNGYRPASTEGGVSPFVPPGWDEWDVADDGYPEFNYVLNENGHVARYGDSPNDYLTDVLSAKARSFVVSAAAAHAPFAIEVATFAPHFPYTPAPRDADALPGLTAPRGASFDQLPAGAPSWLAGRPPLTPQETAGIDADFRRRAQSVQAVDAMIGHLEDTLKAAGLAQNTYLVFGSDNGYHMGEYRLTPGKMTAFDADIEVPLIVVGPGVPAGGTTTAVAQNIDLAPTFEQLGGATIPAEVDGRSLVPLLNGQTAGDWRTAALVEHHGPVADPTDPDVPGRDSGNPTTYEALRTPDATYVEYANGETEYYDRTRDPDELANIAAQLPPAQRNTLHSTLQALRNCHDGASCWAAGHLRD